MSLQAPTPMSSSTANWHWKNKSVTPWARSWFKQELTKITVAEGEQVVIIDEVTEMEGDVELGQRKSKLITIYDCHLKLKWSGTASDGTAVKGTLSIPEVSHEITLDGLSDYVYNWSLTTASSEPVNKLYQLAKSRLPTALEAKFAEFPVVLIDTHGKDLTVTPLGATPSASRTVTPAPTAAAAPKPEVAVKPVKKDEKVVNTATVTVEATFMAAADDLFSLLTDEKRIPTWSRAAAQSKPEAGAPYSLFGGGVKGTYTTLSPPTKIVQTWSLQSPTWPSGHEGTLTTTFDQQSDSTKVTFTLDGVPKGREDEIERNLEGYYVRGLKSIGYVQLIASPSDSARHAPSPRMSTDKTAAPPTRSILALSLGLSVLLAAVVAPYFFSQPPSH